MSFVLHGLHEQQQHAPYLVYNFQDGRTICLACFLHSLSDPVELDSKKQFAVRCAADSSQPVINRSLKSCTVQQTEQSVPATCAG
jgi:hypothetical protein